MSENHHSSLGAEDKARLLRVGVAETPQDLEEIYEEGGMTPPEQLRARRDQMEKSGGPYADVILGKHRLL